MSTTNSTYQSVVEDVLGPRKMREIWTGNYTKALPLSVQSVDLSAVFPAVFYMFRFGQRRGTGKFLEKFGHNSRTAQERRGSTTIELSYSAKTGQLNKVDSRAIEGRVWRRIHEAESAGISEGV